MKILLEVVAIVLLINGIGGLVLDDFGLLTEVADGGALTALQVAAVVVGAAAGVGALQIRRSGTSQDADA